MYAHIYIYINKVALTLITIKVIIIIIIIIITTTIQIQRDLSTPQVGCLSRVDPVVEPSKNTETLGLVQRSVDNSPTKCWFIPVNSRQYSWMLNHHPSKYDKLGNHKQKKCYCPGWCPGLWLGPWRSWRQPLVSLHQMAYDLLVFGVLASLCNEQ